MIYIGIWAFLGFINWSLVHEPGDSLAYLLKCVIIGPIGFFVIRKEINVDYSDLT